MEDLTKDIKKFLEVEKTLVQRLGKIVEKKFSGDVRIDMESLSVHGIYFMIAGKRYLSYSWESKAEPMESCETPNYAGLTDDQIIAEVRSKSVNSVLAQVVHEYLLNNYFKLLK